MSLTISCTVLIYFTGFLLDGTGVAWFLGASQGVFRGGLASRIALRQEEEEEGEAFEDVLRFMVEASTKPKDPSPDALKTPSPKPPRPPKASKSPPKAHQSLSKAS